MKKERTNRTPEQRERDQKFAAMLIEAQDVARRNIVTSYVKDPLNKQREVLNKELVSLQEKTIEITFSWADAEKATTETSNEKS